MSWCERRPASMDSSPKRLQIKWFVSRVSDGTRTREWTTTKESSRSQSRGFPLYTALHAAFERIVPRDARRRIPVDTGRFQLASGPFPELGPKATRRARPPARSRGDCLIVRETRASATSDGSPFHERERRRRGFRAR